MGKQRTLQDVYLQYFIHVLHVCIYVFNCMSPFSPFYMQLDVLIHQLVIRCLKNLE